MAELKRITQTLKEEFGLSARDDVETGNSLYLIKARRAVVLLARSAGMKNHEIGTMLEKTAKAVSRDFADAKNHFLKEPEFARHVRGAAIRLNINLPLELTSLNEVDRGPSIH